MLDGLLLGGEGGVGIAGAVATEALEGFLQEADRLAGQDLTASPKGIGSPGTSSTRTALEGRGWPWFTWLTPTCSYAL